MMGKGTGDYIPPDTLNKMIKVMGSNVPAEFKALLNCSNARPAHIVRIESFLECDIALEIFGDESIEINKVDIQQLFLIKGKIRRYH